jgi:hypothetical protein
MGTILSLEERRWPIEAAAIPFPRPDKTPPVTMMYLVGIFIDDVNEAIFWGEIIRIPVFSQVKNLHPPEYRLLRRREMV